MRKTITILGLLAIAVSEPVKSQSAVNFGDLAKPVPSVSSLATYTNTPISNVTGLPDISFPLLDLPSLHNGASLNIGLSYNPMNVSENEPASHVGAGWSLFAGGVISRSITGDIDEMYDDTTNGNYYKNDYDDLYYYSLPGISGKFKFKRNTVNNTFELINLSSNKIKIEYTRTSNTATLIPDSFTITDAKGTRYIFNDYSRSNQERNVYLQGGKVYKSAFFLTQIKDANTMELANFSYQKNIKYKNNSTIISYETCKLKTISSPGFGKIEFEYSYDPSLENTMNDPYQVQKVILKDHYDHTISAYGFEYFFQSFGYETNAQYKRGLLKLNKLDKNNAVKEVTEFAYATVFPPSPINGGLSSLCPTYLGSDIKRNLGILNKVITPSGGVVEYNFEPAEVYTNKADASYLQSIQAETLLDPEIQYLEGVSGVNYNTNQAIEYTFTIPGSQSRKIFVSLDVEEMFTPPLHWDTNTPAYLDFLIDGAYGTSCGEGGYAREFTLSPGTHKVRITGSGGKGSVSMMGITHIPLPFKNKSTTTGVRIANIRYYNSKTETNPVKTTKFDYDNFSDSNSSTGFRVSSELDSNAASFILYKNVKVTGSDDTNGYVKYYYKTPNDYSKNGNYWPYYAFTSGGILDKKEVYNAQSKLLASEQTNYTFEEIPGAQEYSLWMNNNTSSKLSWLKKSSVTSTSYFDNNQSIEEQSETNYNVYNFEIASTKKVADDNTIEQFYTYPESGYSQLSNAHILSVPVIVEGKNDGKTVSKAETKYDNAGSTLPTSVVAFNVSDTTSKTAKKIDVYDSKGNIVQYSSDTAVPTTIIYGYNQTLPIASIVGVTYAQVSSFVQPIITASNADAQNPANETALITALDTFRKNTALQNAQVTTYTYDPLIGVTTTTSPDGNRVSYKYNASNQLERIVDRNGITLKEYQYNYKH